MQYQMPFNDLICSIAAVSASTPSITTAPSSVLPLATWVGPRRQVLALHHDGWA
eukprot:SAG22_NODE_122_length_18920_cov_23.494076_27_plen_54_part_00